MNKLLSRQIKKYLPPEISNLEIMIPFFKSINDSYHAYERDGVLAERAFKMSEEEYAEINLKLEKELDLKKLSVKKLKDAIAELGIEGFMMQDDNVLEIVELLNTQISKQKQIEIELKASRELWQFALEGAGDGVWDYDFQTRKIFFSKRYKQMLGYDEDEFNNDPEEWMSRIHPEDIHLVMKTDQDYFFKKMDNHIVEYRVRHKNGEYIWVLDRGMVINRTPEGLPARIIGTHTDITKRKLAEQALTIREEKYRNILANMNLGLLEVDNNEIIQFANQSFCDMSGYALSEMVGQKAASLFTLTESIDLLEHKNELRKKGVSDAYELIVTNKKGERKWWLISGAPRYKDSGELVGSIGIHLDITDRKKLELELNEAKIVAEHSVQIKEAFIASMSHEIRTPMNAIMGMGKQLEKTVLSEQQRFFLQTINQAADNLLVIINDILDISKIEAGKLELEQQAFRPREILLHAARVMQLRIEEKGLELKIDIDEDIAQVLVGDSHRINQILLNLISNAVKFTERGSVTISANLQKQIPNAQVIEFRIRDTGMGIAPSFIDRIFDKFSQEDLNTARKYGGTGLGMAITKELVELMQGDISIKSKKNIGTEILISIPLTIGEAEDLPKSFENFSNIKSLEGLRILLADDNEMNRLVAVTVLESYKVLVIEVKNGAEALRVLKKERFDLVLMDMQMPIMDGLEATKIIRNNLKLHIPIIALTANAIKGEAERCLEAGMNGFISKPFTEHDLINAIATKLELENKSASRLADSQVDQINVIPLYSLEKLKKISGDEAFINKMIDLFLSKMPEYLVEIRNAFKGGNISAIEALAHKIKPTIDSLEIHVLKDVIRELENIPHSGGNLQRTERLISQFEDVIEKIIADMKKI